MNIPVQIVGDEQEVLDRVALIVCQAVAELRDPEVPGAIRGRCALCKCEIWMAPSTVRQLRLRSQLKSACVACASAYAIERGQEPTFYATADSWDEYEVRKHAFAAVHGVEAANIETLLPPELVLAVDVGRRQS